MLCGTCYGAMYGGLTTSILINTPGESSSVMTALDGYAMARNGRAGAGATILSVRGPIASMYIGNLVLQVLNLPLVGVFVRLL